MTRPGSIDLLRHGVTDAKGFCGRLDMPLTKTGWQQMRIATPVNIFWGMIVSSPLRRCAEYAHALASQHLLPIRLDDRLRELDFGRWEGQTAEQLMQQDAAALTQFWRDPWTYTPPQAEPLDQFEQRVRSVWTELCNLYRGKRILVVTHAGVIRMLLYLTGKLTATSLLQIDIPYAYYASLEMPVRV